MALTLRKSELDDHYVIERDEPPVIHVEGSATEMRDVAQAIRERGEVTFKRCAVNARHGVFFWSPRSGTPRGSASLAEANALADEIERMLGTEERR